jgi:hypothetical protein
VAGGGAHDGAEHAGQTPAHAPRRDGGGTSGGAAGGSRRHGPRLPPGSGWVKERPGHARGRAAR